MRRTIGPLSVLFAATLIAGGQQNRASAQSTVDKLEQKIIAERIQLIAQERQNELSSRSPQLDSDFWTKMAALTTSYDQHVLLPRLQAARQEGRLDDALVLALKWERTQALLGVETDPETIKQIQAITPAWSEVLTYVYNRAVTTCNSGNAPQNARDIIGANRLAQLSGADAAIPGNAMDEALACAHKAPLFLSFDSHVEMSLAEGKEVYSSDVMAVGVPLYLESVPSNPGALVYTSKDYPLQYTDFKIKNGPGHCSSGSGISGSMVAIATINDDSGNVTVQILPHVMEDFAQGEIGRGGACVKRAAKHLSWYWEGFFLTGGDGPFVMKMNSHHEMSGTAPWQPFAIWTQKSSVEIAYAETPANK
jgi:hypothetical protein